MSEEKQVPEHAFFRFNGASDDTVQVAVQRGLKSRWHYAEYNALGPVSHEGTEWECTLVHDDGLSKEMLRVVATFGALWVVGVGPVDEDTPVPGWDVLLTRCDRTPHSAELQVAAPYGTVMTRILPIPGSQS